MMLSYECANLNAKGTHKIAESGIKVRNRDNASFGPMANCNFKRGSHRKFVKN
jgi:hypothetical protein